MKTPVEKITFSKFSPETLLKMNSSIGFFTLFSQRTHEQMKLTWLSITCSKSTIKTLGQCEKYIQS